MSLFLDTHLFLGFHSCRIDGKGRVSFPASFRSAMIARGSKGIAIFKSLVDPAIEGVTLERLHKLAAAMDRMSSTDPRRSLLQTMMFGRANELAVDKEGRCSPPRALLDQVGIGPEVIFVGQGSTFQIWDPEKFRQHEAKAEEMLLAGGIEVPTLAEEVL